MSPCVGGTRPSSIKPPGAIQINRTPATRSQPARPHPKRPRGTQHLPFRSDLRGDTSRQTGEWRLRQTGRPDAREVARREPPGDVPRDNAPPGTISITSRSTTSNQLRAALAARNVARNTQKPARLDRAAGDVINNLRISGGPYEAPKPLDSHHNLSKSRRSCDLSNQKINVLKFRDVLSIHRPLALRATPPPLPISISRFRQCLRPATSRHDAAAPAAPAASSQRPIARNVRRCNRLRGAMDDRKRHSSRETGLKMTHSIPPSSTVTRSDSFHVVRHVRRMIGR